MLRTALHTALTFALTAPAALAADGEQTKLELPAEEAARTVAAQPGAGGGDVMRAIIGLAVVIGVIYAVYWVLKTLKSSREEQRSGDGLQALATLPLGPNRSLHLVSAGREIVLVGVAEHGVAPIRTYSEDEARSLGLLPGETPVVEAEEPFPFTADIDFSGVTDDAPYGATDGSRKPASGSWIDQLRARTVIK